MNKEANSQGDNASNQQQVNDAQFSISPEKAALFQQRFEEVYDLPDDEYMKWLQHTHTQSTLNQTFSAIKNVISNQTDIGAQVLSEKSLDILNQTDSGAQIPPEKCLLF